MTEAKNTKVSRTVPVCDRRGRVIRVIAAPNVFCCAPAPEQQQKRHPLKTSIKKAALFGLVVLAGSTLLNGALQPPWLGSNSPAIWLTQGGYVWMEFWWPIKPVNHCVAKGSKKCLT
jgi:hypothetical protein